MTWILWRIITAHEYAAAPEHFSKTPQSQRLETMQHVRYDTRSMLNHVFDIHKVAHCEFIPQGETDNTDFYFVRKHLRENNYGEYHRVSALKLLFWPHWAHLSSALFIKHNLLSCIFPTWSPYNCSFLLCLSVPARHRYSILRNLSVMMSARSHTWTWL